MTKIGIGDRVRCVQPDGHWLRKDKIYTVKDVVNLHDAGFGLLLELEKPKSILWNSHRFDLTISSDKV